MLGNTGVWGSYGYRETENELLHQQNPGYPVSEVLYLHSKQDKKSGNGNIHRNNRLEQQRERVFAATVERRLDRRQKLQRDLLREYDKEYVESVLRKDYYVDSIPDNDPDQFNIRQYYQKTEPHKYAINDDTNSLFNYSSKKLVRKRIRPKSAIVGISRTPRSKLLPRSERFSKDKIPRIQSDPTICSNPLNPVAVKHSCFFNLTAEERRRHSRSGCEHCPVECRPVSNSSYRPTSSTGLQANAGPNHYQYFHYDRYIRNQRPRSAIGQRRLFLEKSGKLNETAIPVEFKNIVKSCEFHVNPRSGSPTRSHDGVKEAWTDNSKDKLNIDITLDSARETMEIETDDDNIQNDSVRAQAELAYKAITSDNMILLDIPAEDFTRVPTPTPTLSRAESVQSEKSDEKEPPPIINQGFDMLTGQIFGETKEVEIYSNEGKDSDKEEQSTVDEDPEFQIQVSIQTPPPLPIKRFDVEKVDIVDPDEDTDAEMLLENNNKNTDEKFPDIPTSQPEEEVDIKEPELEDYSRDDILPQTDYTEFDSDSTTGIKSPRSILKDNKDKTSRESSPIRVTFRTKTDVEKVDVQPIQNKDDYKENDIKEPPVIQVPYTDYDKHARKENKTTKKLQENNYIAEKSVDTAIIFTTPAETKVIKEEPLEPVKPVYEEPTDEYLKRLLSSPDLGDFSAPEFPDQPEKTKKKGKKSGGKKKKGKKKKKKKVVIKKPEEPKEPLFEYDPNELSVVEMTKRRLANQKRENNDLISAINTMKIFDDACREKTKNKPWLFGRMALSKQICRFWLPMDLRELEDLTPSQYILQFCVICKRRTKFYTQVFDRNLQRRKIKEPLTDVTRFTLSIKETTLALRDVHADCISDYDIGQLYTLLCIDDKGSRCSVFRVNSGLFVSMCALAERLFYENFVTEDAEDLESSHRKRIELADFDNLTWRLRDVDIFDELRDLLFSL